MLLFSNTRAQYFLLLLHVFPISVPFGDSSPPALHMTWFIMPGTLSRGVRRRPFVRHCRRRRRRRHHPSSFIDLARVSLSLLSLSLCCCCYLEMRARRNERKSNRELSKGSLMDGSRRPLNSLRTLSSPVQSSPVQSACRRGIARGRDEGNAIFSAPTT